MELQHLGICLQQLRHRELSILLGWRNHPEVRRWMHHTATISWNDHLHWFHTHASHQANHYFMLREENKPVPLGLYQLSRIDSEPGCAEVGAFMRPGGDAIHGYLPWIASSVLLHYAFSVLRLKVLWARTAADNHRACHYNEALGFEATELYEADKGRWFRSYQLRARSFYGCMLPYVSLLKRLDAARPGFHIKAGRHLPAVTSPLHIATCENAANPVSHSYV